MGVRLYMLAAAICLSVIASCSLFNTPSRTVKKFHRLVEAGQIDDAAKLMSSRAVSTLGIDKLKNALAKSTRDIKDKGGIKLMEIEKEEVIGEVAEVNVKISFGNGEIKRDKVKLIKENGEWKIDLSK